MDLLLIFFAFLLKLLTTDIVSSSINKPVSTVSLNLHAKWKYTPVHLEAAEVLAADQDEYFWTYIRIINERHNRTNPLSLLNYEQLYKRTIEISEEIIEDSYQLSLLKFSLAQHSSSPMIASHAQMARDRLGKRVRDCKSFIEFPQPPVKGEEKMETPQGVYDTRKVYGDQNIVCNVIDASKTIESILSTPDYMSLFYQPTVYKADHIYYARNNPKGKTFEISTAILYGEIGTEEFQELYEFSKEMANLGKMNFVVRHLVTHDTHKGTKQKPKISLGGYGVELAIKSTEYKAQDDTKVKGENTGRGDDEVRGIVERPDEIEDLIFNELAITGNNWKSTNPKFHEQILESIEQIPTINTSDIVNLSTQAVSLILRAPIEKQLLLMRDLSQNFPILAKSLAGENVDGELATELEYNQMLFSRFLNLAPSDAALFLNGMFFDVDALDMFALFEVIKSEYKNLQEGNVDSDADSDVERFLEKRYQDKHSKLVVPPEKPNEPFLKMLVIFDPLTRGCQKILPILINFRKVFNLQLKFMFNCVDKHHELPLKSFYRFVIETEPMFKNGPNSPAVLRTTFRNLPRSSLLTLNMATPENWLVESVKTPFDLDNIHLGELTSGSVWADFELEHLLIEGHCFDITNGSPPRGLQFVLGTQDNPALFDTIVMANLGYFQLKASPGAWSLRLRHGRSSEIYVIFHVDGADSVRYQDPKLKSEATIPPILNDFRSRFLKMRVHKRKGQGHRDLLSDENGDESNYGDIWGSIRNSVWSGSIEEDDAQALERRNTELRSSRTSDANRINIFSLASGHLYERLARIMMLSVLKNTNTPVKFWFLKNYISPSFKDFLPYYAEKYNFDYELVQYKWPRWLHQQSEKQRIIWGYKILFLDVLFPLDVKKIIFVDADQVVRADLKELRDLDLGGAPYGYTPFCDSRTDMDGFRFWKTGYWNTHLHGRKYHISALYVVDLQKFRKIAAGDRLRGQYQGLSQDPNSLSNLDQDLPNNMIHQVAIKSLPQEWLWCETWCSDSEKEKAKTIDLCNNPQTKEPKLTAARRIIKEWQGYDDEIRFVYEEFLEAQEQLDRSIDDSVATKSYTIPSQKSTHDAREFVASDSDDPALNTILVPESDESILSSNLEEEERLQHLTESHDEL